MTSIIRGDAKKLPLADNSVDLVITSPPYFALRSYADDDDHYEGQVGSEESPSAFLAALWGVTRELQRVVKPTGSIFVNLGDKWAGSGGHNNAGVSAKSTLQGNGHVGGGPKLKATRRSAPDRYNQNTAVQAYDGGSHCVSVPAKALMGLPWRYALGCCDRLGLLLRAEIIWDKPNHLPESVTDRVVRSHEQWFHFTNGPRYYAAIDELREPYESGESDLGKLPGSVWRIPTEPLHIPEGARDAWGLPDHFAAFPTEWPRRMIAGWSPPAICLECGRGRWPVVHRERRVDFDHADRHRGPGATNANPTSSEKAGPIGRWMGGGARVLGYACECTPFTDHAGTGESSGRTYAEGVAAGSYTSNDFGGRLKNRPKVGGWREYHLDGWKPPPSRPAVVLDPFGGTGTVAMVARTMGRTGISLDMSADYCRLASWRIFRSGHAQKARDREEQKTVITFDL